MRLKCKDTSRVFTEIVIQMSLLVSGVKPSDEEMKTTVDETKVLFEELEQRRMEDGKIEKSDQSN